MAAGGTVSVDSFRDYLRRIGSVPLLDAADEVDLAKAIEAGVYARRILDGAAVRPDGAAAVPPADLAEIARLGDAARDRMVEANLRLVVSVAKRWSWSELDLTDLVQEGNLGLSRAIAKFDYARGFKFSTYATWWIRQYVGRAVHETGRAVRLPAHQGDRVEKARKAHKALSAELGREPDYAEVAAATGLDARAVPELLMLARPVASLDETAGEDGTSGLADRVADPTAALAITDAEDAVDATARDAAVAAALDALDPRTAYILRRRFGIDGDAASLDDVGRELGMAREMVRQVESRAVAALRAAPDAARMRAWLA